MLEDATLSLNSDKYCPVFFQKIVHMGFQPSRKGIISRREIDDGYIISTPGKFPGGQASLDQKVSSLKEEIPEKEVDRFLPDGFFQDGFDFIIDSRYEEVVRNKLENLGVQVVARKPLDEDRVELQLNYSGDHDALEYAMIEWLCDGTFSRSNAHAPRST